MPLIDQFQREVSYLRMSVTDRCDFRCLYCMAEEMTFLPRSKVLTLEEIEQIAAAFVALGVRKIRITGGEPLVRKNLSGLLSSLNQLHGLDELVITTNGSRLQRFAPELKAAGVQRVNISLDSLKPDRFKQLTRVGCLADVLAGIEAARRQSFQRIKINSVILRGVNDDEVVDLVRFVAERDLDISFIEEMPLGQVQSHSRAEAFIESDELRERIENEVGEIDKEPPARSAQAQTGGPSVYYRLRNHSTRIGFISPHSHNFCHLCNRVRLTAEGRLLLCLGNEYSVDLRAVIRSSIYLQATQAEQEKQLQAAIVSAMAIKPERHHFTHDDQPQLVRFMNMTGG